MINNAYERMTLNWICNTALMDVSIRLNFKLEMAGKLIQNFLTQNSVNTGFPVNTKFG